MSSNGNGKWVVAFWVISVLCVGSYGFTLFSSKALADAVICNDRIRSTEDQSIRKDNSDNMQDVQSKFETISNQLAMITTKLEYLSHETRRTN